MACLNYHVNTTKTVIIQKSVQGVGGGMIPLDNYDHSDLRSLESLIVKDQQNHNIITLDLSLNYQSKVNISVVGKDSIPLEN